MDAVAKAPHPQVSFDTDPARYHHWKISYDGPVATLGMDVKEDAGLSPDYRLKLNSYDLGVDIELADALQRLRFEHPEVRVVVITSLKERVFCAGANIFMLRGSSHAWKVNFCKFTNETRLAIEDASANSGIKFIAALNGICAGGGYELALACDEILLVDDGNSAVSLPETPLLGVLPGTGGLTRVVDKRKVRRDLADVFGTVAEGVKGRRAVEWRLVDAVYPTSQFKTRVAQRATELAMASDRPGQGPGIRLNPLVPVITDASLAYSSVRVDFDRQARVATLTVAGPEGSQPSTPDEMLREGDRYWPLRAFRELDDALLHLRFDLADIGVVTVRTSGDPRLAIAHDEALAAATTGFAREVRLLQRRVLKRFDNTARSFYAVADRPDSCFAGALRELALGADRFYMLIDKAAKVAVATSVANHGFMTMSSGLSRLDARFYGEPERAKKILARGSEGPIASEEAEQIGIATIAADDIDFADELRIAVEERASLSPDALTGMEQSLRFVGPETLETKIFGRLSAWQNWIFTRANSTGEHGALTLYGQPERPQFQWKRT
jgi:benzoyl-CoA-dihydrodiol lyase